MSIILIRSAYNFRIAFNKKFTTSYKAQLLLTDSTVFRLHSMQLCKLKRKCLIINFFHHTHTTGWHLKSIPYSSSII